MNTNLFLHADNLLALQYLLDNGFKSKTSFPPNSNNKTTSVENNDLQHTLTSLPH
jgi:hypothetical protein